MYTMIGILGPDNDALDVLYRGMKGFGIDKVIVIAAKEFEYKAQEAKKDLEKFRIPVDIYKIKDHKHMEQVFDVIRQIKEIEKEKNLMINVDTDYMSSCLALSSAFVNGIQAIGMMDEEVIAYPIMKFSYYNALSDKKTTLLNLIFEKGQYNSFEELSKDTGMSLPLVTYHIKGTHNKPGLEEMGLVSAEKINGKIKVRLSQLGRLISKGCVDYERLDEKKKLKKK